ncbi:MAG TPA: glycoside hydrolase family 2 TIM barrel-domain containing protein, partial [Pyrinomonadaceae bacterium]|nr:glycoside hydrolase family 2 TIM barrel-domain containing protein [Pyrinomonadaceae bacterium]
GWYRKAFNLPATTKGKLLFIGFDGVYRNSEVWINGRYLGKRPYGYSSFQYELTPHLNFGAQNVIAVKVDNSQQPNSRWYSGSGIYRNVWLTTTEKARVDHWGTYVTTPEASEKSATVAIKTRVRNDSESDVPINLSTIIYDSAGKEVARASERNVATKGSVAEVSQQLKVISPMLWSDERPYLYKVISKLEQGGREIGSYETPLGIRSFVFDVNKGFTLNGKPVKIRGVCNHHDLGSLGAAINTRALERQLEILKAMGANGLRTAHNPPAPELLDLADRMGFIVMDEAFDMWKRGKTKFDYHLDWEEWHKRDLEDMVLRDRNHPSIFIWSIGNEVSEQWGGNPEAGNIGKQLGDIVRNLDTTRPITAACNFVSEQNTLIMNGGLDLIGTNYEHNRIPALRKIFPARLFIGTETTSALATRGSYDMPSELIRRWPARWDEPFKHGNPDYSCSAYDNVSAPWGSTHEETWKIVKKHDFFSGMFIWTGWDYLGEPTPYSWPAVSSYFGIIDRAGFPKDTFYMYQSEWTSEPVLHLFPHWNWKQGQEVDVWAYFNSDEVELFLNGRSLGTKRKIGDDLHVFWRVKYEPGTLKAIARKDGKVVLTREVRTAEEPARIILIPDRAVIKADGADLSFVTVKIVDRNGTPSPHADNLVNFEISGEGSIAGVDNGSHSSHESFKASQRKAFNGLALAIVRTHDKAGKISLKATSPGLSSAQVLIEAR